MKFPDGFLELLIEVLTRFDQAEPFLGSFDTVIPPVGAGYRTNHLHAGGQTFRDQSMGNGVGVFLALCCCDDLDEVWDGEAPLYSGTVIASAIPGASQGKT
jgi:hypothetical protein